MRLNCPSEHFTSHWSWALRCVSRCASPTKFVYRGRDARDFHLRTSAFFRCASDPCLSRPQRENYLTLLSPRKRPSLFSITSSNIWHPSRSHKFSRRTPQLILTSLQFILIEFLNTYNQNDWRRQVWWQGQRFQERAIVSSRQKHLALGPFSPFPAVRPRPVSPSPSVVCTVFYGRATTPSVLVLARLSILRQFSSTWLPKFSSWLATLPVTTRRRVSFPVISSSPSAMMRSWTSFWVTSPSRKVVSCPTFTRVRTLPFQIIFISCGQCTNFSSRPPPQEDWQGWGREGWKWKPTALDYSRLFFLFHGWLIVSGMEFGVIRFWALGCFFCVWVVQ